MVADKYLLCFVLLIITVASRVNFQTVFKCDLLLVKNMCVKTKEFWAEVVVFCVIFVIFLLCVLMYFHGEIWLCTI